MKSVEEKKLHTLYAQRFITSDLALSGMNPTCKLLLNYNYKQHAKVCKLTYQDLTGEENN